MAEPHDKTELGPPVPSSPSSSSSGSADELVAYEFSHYRVTARLGQGGMGVVHRAVDTRLGRNVALKFLAADLARDADARRRLRREAQAASALDHPHIATVYEVGEHDGRVYIAMAFYDGETLRERIARGPSTVADAERIGRQLLQALAAAHAAGILHRDVKPANVIITRDGDVKLVDFGLAKIVDDGATQLTAEGTLLGTLQYMSPEQLRGVAVDGRADLWATGAVLFEMLTGQAPFSSPSRAALMTQILTREAPPLSRARRDVPAPLRTLVEALLIKDAARRPPSATAALEILDGHRRAPRRRPRWHVAAALAAIVALGGGGVWLSSWLRSTETLADARATFERGVREFELRRYDDARRDFEEAYRLHGDAALLLDAAQGYRKGGRNEDALYFYRLYLKRDPETPSRAIVEEQIRRLEKIVPGP